MTLQTRNNPKGRDARTWRVTIKKAIPRERKRYRKERKGGDEKEWKLEKGRAQQEIYWHRRFPLQGSLSQNI
jgi:hypothetical protein